MLLTTTASQKSASKYSKHQQAGTPSFSRNIWSRAVSSVVQRLDSSQVFVIAQGNELYKHTAHKTFAGPDPGPVPASPLFAGFKEELNRLTLAVFEETFKRILLAV